MNWLFKELVLIALDREKNLSRKPTVQEWREAYFMAEKQALVGLMFSAVERINEDNNTAKPSLDLLYQWMGESIQIENQNKKMNTASEQLYEIFKNRGARSCVLKGQGIATLYNHSLRRQSGDVDLWVEGGRRRVLGLLKDNFFGTGMVVLHHVDVRIIDGVESEIHFIPVYACNPMLHYKLQCYFKKHADEQFAHYDEKYGFSYPTLRFNAVYILAHIYMHFLYEGVGLRQIIDYYYVLINLKPEVKKQASADIKKAGLIKFAGAVMYVLTSVCQIDQKHIIAAIDIKRGTLLLEEILRSGNFGKYDEQLKGRDERELIKFNLVALKRQLRFIRYYPWDIISIPFFKIWHWGWRKMNGFL